MFHDHIDRQAKKLGALEEALQETKTMFSRLYQVLTAQEQCAPQVCTSRLLLDEG